MHIIVIASNLTLQYSHKQLKCCLLCHGVAKFSHPNIAASYCGRIWKSSVKNNVGSSLAKDTYVTVLRKCFMLLVLQYIFI